MVSFATFFYIWAVSVMGWNVPDCHWRAVSWLEHRGDLAVLRCFRGFGKSTILAIYSAWRLYSDHTYRILNQSESDPTAYKTSRDTQYVLRRHPLTAGLLPVGTGTVEQWWINGSTDARNASMYSRGILSNVTSSRANECINDDIEVPRNIQNVEGREKLRYRLGEQTHILIPGGRTLFCGTPHCHDSIYDEYEQLGADCLTIPLFHKEFRIEKEIDFNLKFDVPFKPEFVFVGIYKGARLLNEGIDYKLTDTGIEFGAPPDAIVDCYAGCEWSDRFDRKEMAKRRKKTRTLGEWDSQYQLHSKPVTETRLDPDRIREYNVEPEIKSANGEMTMWLGKVQIVGAVAYWDVALGKIKSDASAFSLLFTDMRGHLYWHVCEGLKGELAEFDGDDKIYAGQVIQIRNLVTQYQIPRVVVEVNGPGGFAPKLLRQALKGSGCGVVEEFSVANKQKRILDAFEAPLSTRFLWAHSRVIDGPMPGQMKEFNPKIADQPDDYIDSGAGAIIQTPVRIGKLLRDVQQRENSWRVSGGVYEIATEY